MKRLNLFVSISIIFFSVTKLCEASIAKEMRITNVTDSQIIVSWITDVEETCHVNYGLTPATGLTAYDVRGLLTSDDTHYVKITGLNPETIYYFELVSGATVDNNNGMYYQAKTGADIKRSGLDFAYGRVFKSDAVTYATGAIVYFYLKDGNAQDSPGNSALWSSLVDSNGYWSENLINLRTQDGKEFFEYSVDGGDNLILYGEGAKEGTASLSIFTNQDSPAPDMILTSDRIKPSAITTLAVKQVTSNSIFLNWIAPGDDGNSGQASLYDLRWSYAEINEGNFKNATPVPNLPTPLPAGNQQEFEVKGLLPDTLYYFAIKTRDEAGNWSNLSNIVFGKTLPPPTSMLAWTGEYNFVKDALRLDFGTLGTNFVYMVKYIHPGNLAPQKGEPKIILYKETIPIGTYSLTYANGTFSTGAIYTYSKVFAEKGEYSYKFYCQGADGEPTLLTKGPIVSDIETGVRITNQTDAQFTVSWVTSQSTTGYIKYGTNIADLNKIGDDDRGQSFSGQTHYVTVKGLEPEKIYYFDVVSGGVVDNNSGNHYISQTGPSVLASGSDLVYGQVFKQGGAVLAKNSIVYLELKDNDGQDSPLTSAIASALVQDNGYWMADLVNFRTLNLSAPFEYSPMDDLVCIFVQGANEGIGSEIVMTANDSPASPVELCLDTVAPASITTLQVIKAGIGSITLKWQATGDDKTIGTATSYDIRYATFTITESSWGLANEVQLEPAPALPGVFQEFVVKNLNTATTYYFGIKAIDEVWNISELSHIAIGSTTPEIKHPPILDWVGEGEYLKDGVYPDTGNNDMKFTFQVKYIDLDNDAPKSGEPKVIIKSSGTYTMSYVKGTYSTGAIYKYTTFLPSPGTYTYRFFATDASGSPTFTMEGPIVTDIPYRETNITDSQFTISWPSTKLEIGTVNYGTNPDSLILSFSDNRVDDTHHIDVTGLTANTLYYYDVVCGGVKDDNQGFHYKVQTGASIIPTPDYQMVYGKVYKQGCLEYADGAIVYIQLQDKDNKGDLGNSAWASVLVRDGEWRYNLVNLRTANHQSFFDDWSGDKDELYLFAEGSLEGTDTLTIFPINGTPAEYMELSRDITPPGTTTLIATNTTPFSVTLFWRAAGDDKKLGTATSYDIRYSKGVIDENTWATANQVIDEPKPLVAGTEQQLIITDLEPDTLYYFGLKSIDEAGNASSISIATATTKPHPPPALKWINEPNYQEDGLEPEKGSVETVYTYYVDYFHTDNLAPAPGFPKLHILADVYTMVADNPADTNYRDGKRYKYIKIFALSGTYTYSFEAKDTANVLAQGTPTQISSGPVVGVIPVLTWTKEEGYGTDGLEPEIGPPNTTFTYRINYLHSQNIPPAQDYPKVYISGPVNQSFPMQEVDSQDTDYTNGKFYTFSIALTTMGKYYYHFEAKDTKDFLATTQEITGPIIANAPVLSWVDADGYKTDGIEPNTGNNKTIFTYKVRYCDVDNNPPDLYYPKLYVLRGGEMVYERKMYRIEGNDYVTGIVYCVQLPLIIASDYYSYYFEAKNARGVLAVGTPTNIHPGPLVNGPNYPPRLQWIGKGEYIADGLNPETGTVGTTFTYQIKYSDMNADPPQSGYPLVYLYRGETFLGTKTMSYLYGSFTNGAVFEATYTFKSTGIYKYKFEAKDKKGSPASMSSKIGPLISTAPTLEAGTLTPAVGTINLTTFTYKVTYKDADNDPPNTLYPVVHIFKDGNEIIGSPCRMEPENPADITYNDGKVYKFTRIFDQAGSFTYQFEAYDCFGVKATAPLMAPGPIVRSAPTLNWTYESGYLNDGLEPEAGTIQTIFTYRVNYTDLDNQPPLSNYPVVHILKGGHEILDSPFVLEEVDTLDTIYKDGKLFTLSYLFSGIGTYSYYFEAYDSLNIKGEGPATGTKTGPSIIEGPILKWANEEGYINDGINPGTGTRYVTNFTYKVTYQDPTGYPPATGYPRVHIFRGGNPEYPNGQQMFIKVGDDYKIGVTYSFSTTFPIGGKHYTYYFEAKNTKGMFASGEPTNEQEGPIVEGPNFKPTLFWSQKQGFISDGIDPNFGTLKTDFTYQILYQDTNGDPPAIGYPIVYIYKQANLIATTTMNFVDGNWAKGANYAYSTTLPQKGEYQYQFKVKDEPGEEVIFPPYAFATGPKVSGSPQLWWTQEIGYTSDGLEPETGTKGTIFTYRVVYVDEDNEPPGALFPKLHILKGEVEILAPKMWEANPADTKYDDGKIYKYSISLTTPGTYTYRFEAQDVNGLLAVGTPTILQPGPKVIPLPFLDWVGVGQFTSDGLDPEAGTPGTKFTFRIKYIDLDNLPPGIGSPKVVIFSNQQPHTSSVMQVEDIYDDNYTDGKLYGISIFIPQGTYTYKFEAENIEGGKAIGLPAQWQYPGPQVSNAPQVINGRVNPGTGTKDTLFTYIGEYKDIDNDPPATNYPKVCILKNGKEIAGSPFKMNADGNEYKFSTYLPAGINYTYRFIAKDIYGVEGMSQDYGGPFVNNIPVLLWAGDTGYTADGLEPEVGTTGTMFTFLVKYKDIDNDPPGTGSPKVHIFKADQTIPGSPFAMTAVNPEEPYINGKRYKLVIAFNENGSYSYRFEAEDMHGSLAVGEPVQRVSSGPQVSISPSLDWLGMGDYITSGVSPNTGTIGTEFVYMIKYTDLDNDPPGTDSPKVDIFKNQVRIADSPFKMDEVYPADMDYTDGKWYKFTKRLPSCGTYSCNFIARDNKGLFASGEPTIIKEGPIITGQPILEWTGKVNYITDGVDPDPGLTSTYFTYQVKYIDINNSAPQPGYPKLYILMDGQIFSPYPYGVTMYRKEGYNYQEGVIYTTPPIRLPFASTKYGYYFVAKNTEGQLAKGTPTLPQTGPTVTGNNNRPMLLWANQSGYIYDGLEPEAGTSGTIFTYLIIYRDLNGDEPFPGNPLLHIYKGDTFFTSTTMKKENGDFYNGALYSYSTAFEQNGNYKYKFSAKDIYGADCYPSAPTNFKSGPNVGAAPKLMWIGTGSFQSDGLDPETGIVYETIFTYKVKYQDDENTPPASGYPRVHILKKGMAIDNSPFPMTPIEGGDYQTGKGYQFFKRLVVASAEYTYYFEAKNTSGIYAIGTPTVSINGPDVTGEPLLIWCGDKPEYLTDGLDPEFGTEGTRFTYRVSYRNANNDPPDADSPRVHIFKQGVEIPNSPFLLVEENPADTDYEDGKLYNVTLTLVVGTYTYKFAAESNHGISATGTATFIRQGPQVTLAPQLTWVNKEGYITDGLHPETGSATTPFVYRIIYTDNEPPTGGYPVVHILKAHNEINGSPFVMKQTNPADLIYNDGKEYEFTATLTASGKDYEYFFEAKDIVGISAKTSKINAPVVTNPPELKWVDEDNYRTDGLHPELGTWGTEFIYKVRYQDANNDMPAAGFPKIHILKGGTEISGAPFPMLAANQYDTNCVDGKDYYFKKTLSETGKDYTYFFEAEDEYGIKAEGTATTKKDAPDVSREPILLWTGNAGFIEDGVEPELGTTGTKFTYQVKYFDPDNDPPTSGFPKLHIYREATFIGSFTMNPMNTIYQYETTLPLGNYSYFFEARDNYGILAVGTPTSLKNKPFVTDAPILDWVDEEGFKTDGVKPDSGNTDINFTYKIKYIDSNNNPPITGYPKVVIFKNVLVLGTFTMKEVDVEDITYTDGKLYYFNLQFAESSIDYRYKFIAKDSNGMDAVGKIELMNGPQVNNSPVIDWTKESGYISDGIDPNFGTTKEKYIYRVKYTDKDNHPPFAGYPKLYIYSQDVPIQDSPITMNPVDTQDGTYTDGKLYTLETTFEEGTYTYKFEARDIYQATATGVATAIQFGPTVNDAPELIWVDADGFRTDGVDPNIGSTNSRFTYKVLYRDVKNIPPAPGYPRVNLYIGGILIRPSSLLIKENENDNDYTDGVIYGIYDVRYFYASDAYSYRFEAKNNNNVEAIGEATTIHSGPKVEGVNYSPLLLWTGESDYIDGCNPDSGAPDTPFTFHTAYLDINVDPPAPGYPAVLIYKDDKPYGIGTYTMDYVNGSYLKGATYSKTIFLNATGTYKYKFYAKDNKGEEARGLFTILRVGPKVSHAPKLEWAGQTGFQTDGLEPHEGIVRETYFTFKVKYKDEDGDAP
ncbi:MAG: fibronectin type III domain-containing protein, partial [bacterium]